MKRTGAVVLVYAAVFIGLFWVQNAWSALFAFHAAILFSLTRAPVISLSNIFRSTSIKWAAVSLLICGSSGVLIYYLWEYLGVATDLPAQLTQLGLNGPRSWGLFIAYFVLANPILEELFWRKQLGSDSRGLYISDVQYAGYHLLILLGKTSISTMIVSFAALVIAGWAWRQIAHRDHGLLAPILGHAAADLAILLAVFLRIT